jgi:hypothetical protein
MMFGLNVYHHHGLVRFYDNYLMNIDVKQTSFFRINEMQLRVSMSPTFVDILQMNEKSEDISYV